MTLFRLHRTFLDDSLKTLTEVSSLNEVVEYCKNEFLGYPIYNLTCEYYYKDIRLEDWHKTYMIKCFVEGTQVVLGFSNDNLDYISDIN